MSQQTPIVVLAEVWKTGERDCLIVASTIFMMMLNGELEGLEHVPVSLL